MDKTDEKFRVLFICSGNANVDYYSLLMLKLNNLHQQSITLLATKPCYHYIEYLTNMFAKTYVMKLNKVNTSVHVYSNANKQQKTNSVRTREQSFSFAKGLVKTVFKMSDRGKIPIYVTNGYTLHNQRVQKLYESEKSNLDKANCVSRVVISYDSLTHLKLGGDTFCFPSILNGSWINIGSDNYSTLKNWGRGFFSRSITSAKKLSFLYFSTKDNVTSSCIEDVACSIMFSPHFFGETGFSRERDVATVSISAVQRLRVHTPHSALMTARSRVDMLEEKMEYLPEDLFQSLYKFNRQHLKKSKSCKVAVLTVDEMYHEAMMEKCKDYKGLSLFYGGAPSSFEKWVRSVSEVANDTKYFIFDNESIDQSRSFIKPKLELKALISIHDVKKSMYHVQARDQAWSVVSSEFYKRRKLSAVTCYDWNRELRNNYHCILKNSSDGKCTDITCNDVVVVKTDDQLNLAGKEEISQENYDGIYDRKKLDIKHTLELGTRNIRCHYKAKSRKVFGDRVYKDIWYCPSMFVVQVANLILLLEGKHDLTWTEEAPEKKESYYMEYFKQFLWAYCYYSNITKDLPVFNGTSDFVIEEHQSISNKLRRY